MIYTNDKKINSDGTDKFSREYASALKKIKKRGFPVIFKLSPSRIKKVKTTTGPVNEWNKPYIPYTATISGEEGGEKWVYSRTTPTIKDGNLIFKNNGRWMYKTSFNLGMKDIDLIFFLEYKCPLVKQGTIYVENKAAEAQEKASKLASDVEVQYMIYGDSSPLSSFPLNLRKLGAAWGVINAVEKRDGEYIIDLAIIKNELFDAVKSGEKRNERGFKEFMDSVSAHKLVNKRAQIQQAIDRKLIKYISKEYSWVFLDQEGNDVGKITRITPQQIGSKIEALNDYLNLHDYDYSLIEKAVKHGDEFGGDSTVRVEKPKREEIQIMKFPEMVEEAKKCKGIRYTGVTGDVLRKSLMEYHEYA